MLGKLRPPITQKPINTSGYFNEIWSRFFLNLETESEQAQSSDIQKIMSTMSQQSSMQSIQTLVDNDKLESLLQQASHIDTLKALETSIADLTLKSLLLVSENFSYQKKIDDLEQRIILLESDYQSQIVNLKSEITDINKQLPFFGIKEG